MTLERGVVVTVLFALLALAGIVGAAVFAVMYFGQLKVVSAVEEECETKIAAMEQKTNERLARYQNVVSIEDHVSKLQHHAKQWEQHIAAQQQEWNTKVAAYQKAVTDLEAAVKAREDRIEALRQEMASVEESLDIQSFGFYEPRYDFTSSDEYKDRLKQIRQQQKQMVKDGEACTHATEWHVEGSAAKGRQMMKEQQKMMLLAFNGEADVMVAKVKFNNVKTYEKRLRKAFESINTLGKAQQASISSLYLDLKMQELHLAYEHARKVEDEKEEQRQIKEQMREEAKAEAELKKAQEKADKEEADAMGALEKAKAQLQSATDANSAQATKLQGLVADLESRLKEALDRKAKAMARAQLTKSGHVYVLSNIGSFGESVYKIGMTRRFEPLLRVKELSDASVPFPFDVHAMIYTEDAPALENALHKHFDDRRVNCVNMRKEYFRVELNEIADAVAQYHGRITIVTVPEAEEYRETVAKLRERHNGEPQTEQQAT